MALRGQKTGYQEDRMKPEGKKEEQMAFRLSKKIRELLASRAKHDHCKDSDVVRTALEEYLYKEVNDNNLIIEHLPRMIRILDRIQQSVELSNEVNIFWLKYFFAYAPDFPNKEIALKQMKIGENLKQDFLEQFKEYKRTNNKSWLEQLVMEFFEFGSNEGTIK